MSKQQVGTGDQVVPIEYGREHYVKLYAQRFNCEANELVIAAHLINKAKNYLTAAAFIFGLSWKFESHRPYLTKAAAHLAEYLKDAADVDGTFLYEYQQAYVTEVDTAYPG
jgi:hypothetical protein